MRTGILLAILCPALGLAQAGTNKNNRSPLTIGDTRKKRVRSWAASRLRVLTAGSILRRLFPHKRLPHKIGRKEGGVVAITGSSERIVTNPAVLPLSAGSAASIKEQADTLIFTNTPLAALVDALNTAGRLGEAHTIIVDESCCARKLNIILPLEALTNPDCLKQTLRPYGLALTPVHRRLSMFVLTEDPPLPTNIRVRKRNRKPTGEQQKQRRIKNTDRLQTTLRSPSPPQTDAFPLSFSCWRRWPKAG